MTEIETDYEEVEIEEARPHEQQTGKYIMTVCKVCGTAFATSRKKIRKYCSRECRESLRLKVVCAHCGKLFAARRRRKARRRYCSAACCGKAWRKARLEAQTCESAPVYLTVSQLRHDQKLRAARRKAALRKSDRAWKKVATTKRRLSDGRRTIEYRGWGFGSAAKLSN